MIYDKCFAYSKNPQKKRVPPSDQHPPITKPYAPNYANSPINQSRIAGKISCTTLSNIANERITFKPVPTMNEKNEPMPTFMARAVLVPSFTTSPITAPINGPMIAPTMLPISIPITRPAVAPRCPAFEPPESLVIYAGKT